eukprot:1159574-Pelagomonas_calceolata.AAC.1
MASLKQRTVAAAIRLCALLFVFGPVPVSTCFIARREAQTQSTVQRFFILVLCRVSADVEVACGCLRLVEAAGDCWGWLECASGCHALPCQ